MSKFLFLMLLLSSTAAVAEEAATPKIYVIPGDVNCVVRKKDRLTYCTDKGGVPITGELRKYRDNSLIRTYPQKDGLLEGVAMSYYIQGGKLAQKPYVAGKLNGTATHWYDNGKVESVIPYVNGKKEGVAKYYYRSGTMQGQGVFIADKLNGPSRLYDAKGKTAYELVYQNGVLVSGTCAYTALKSQKVEQKKLDSGLIAKVNNKRLALKPALGKGDCAVE